VAGDKGIAAAEDALEITPHRQTTAYAVQKNTTLLHFLQKANASRLNARHWLFMAPIPAQASRLSAGT
jgi:hypothetical protein